MASRYTIEEALEAILDDDFGLSDGETSDEDGEDIYHYVGEPVLRRIDVQDLGDSIVGSHLVDLGEDADDSRYLLDVSEQNEPDISSDSLSNEHERSDDVQSSVHESVSYDMHGNGNEPSEGDTPTSPNTDSVGSSPSSDLSQTDRGGGRG